MSAHLTYWRKLLLMEYLALLTTGRRLKQVLALQAERLREPGRELQRDAARVLTAAHSLGVGLDADRLGVSLVSSRSVGGEATSRLEDVGDALSVLKNEHIVIKDGRKWQGLHELRSQTLAELLHESPPPTLAMTWTEIARMLDLIHASWLVRRVAERSPNDLPFVAKAVASSMRTATVTAAEVAALFEGAERADNIVYALACRPILDSGRHESLSIHNLALLVYPVRNQGMVLGRTGNPIMDRLSVRVNNIASQLPERTGTIWVATSTELAAALEPEVLDRLLSSANLADTARLLESTAHLVNISADSIRGILSRFPSPTQLKDIELWARIINFCSEHVHPSHWSSIFGTVEQRAMAAIQCDPNALSAEVNSAGGSVTIQRLLPLEAANPVSPSWDTPRTTHSNDLVNSEAVACAQRLADACPELTTFEIITLTASGSRFKIANTEPGYKRMQRDAFKDRISVRRAVGFQAALQRISSAYSWTDIIREQIDISRRLNELVDQGITRLGSFDNEGRRRQWKQDLVAIRTRTSVLAARTADVGIDPTISHAQADQSERKEDPTGQALDSLSRALLGVTERDKPLALAMSLRDANKKLQSASALSNPVMEHLGSPIPQTLVESVHRLAGLLVVLDRDPSSRRRLRGIDTGQIADSLIREATEKHRNQQREILSHALSSVQGAQLHAVCDPEAYSWSLDDTAWVVAVPVETWAETLKSIRALNDDQRRKIGCRVVIVATATISNDCISLQGGNLSFTPNETPTLLPIAVQMGHKADRPEHPLPIEAVAPLIQEIGFPLHAGGDKFTTLMEVIRDLIRISWEHARNSSRTLPWIDFGAIPSSGQSPIDILGLDDLRHNAIAIANSMDDDVAAATMNAMNILFDHVSQELNGFDCVPLAGELFDQHGRTTRESSPAPHLLEAFGILSLAGLYENRVA